MTVPGPIVPVLRMSGIRKDYGATRALDDVSFELETGQVHALLGENGAGKSTLVKILSGAVRPDSGRMEIDGAPYCPADPLGGRRRGISMIYQELNLAPHLTVEENICLGREEHTAGFLDRKAMKAAVREALAFVDHPEISPDIPVRKLSVGARQVVEIARAVMRRAKILVMDEPTSSLSREDGERLFDIVRRLKTQGVSVVYISHFLEEVRRVADAYTVLRDGKNAGSGAMEGTSLDALIQLMVGQRVAEMFPRIPHATGDVVLSITDLKGRTMGAPVSLELRRGEILGIAGLIGSGRTEMLRTLFGLEPLESGRIEIAGKRAGGRTPLSRIGQGLGLLSEDRGGEGLALNMTVADNIALSDFGPYVRRGLIDLDAQKSAVRGWIGEMRIKTGGPGQRVASLSGGNQQKVALARLLHQKAEILLLDEPTRGVDVVSKVQIYEWIGGLASRGKAVLFVSSYLPELLGVCDRIAVFHRGNCVEARPAADWDAAALMAAATVGRTS
jgi:ribose transport system ATP-binding protein